MDKELELGRTVLRQGELKLQAQLQIAIASDRRAMGMARIFIPIAVAMAALGVERAFADPGAWELVLALLAMSACLVVASAQFIKVAAPVDFWTVGNQPENWWSDNVHNRPLFKSVRRESENYQRYIYRNNSMNLSNANRFRRALGIGAITPVVGAVTGLLAWVLGQAVG